MSNTEWKKVKLGDICTITSGTFLRKDKQNPDGKYPVYNGGTTETGYTDNFNTNGPKVVISARGSAGFVNLVGTDFWAGNSCYALYPKTDSVDFNYLYHAVKAQQSFMENITQTGGGVPALNKGQVEQVEISLPPIEEQRRIASLLSRFDELIQLHEFKADNLIKAKQQIMSDIFSGGLRELESINPDAYVQDNWVTVKLGDIFDIRNGYTPSKSVSEYWENGTIPWFRVEDIRENGRILSDAIQHVNIAGVKGGKLMPANSLILSTSATVGEHALVTVDCLTNQRFISCTLKSKYKNSIDLMYLFYCFYNLGEWCRDNADAGSTFSSIPTARVKEYNIKIPPTLEEQQKIANLLSSYDSLIELKRSQKQQVTNMKQQLMSQLLTNGGGAEQLGNC